MPRANYGKVIDPETRALNYLSPSGMQTGDPSTETGCYRKFVYQYFYGIKDPPSQAMLDGTEGHAQIEHFLLTGDRSQLSSRVLQGMPFIPEPGDDLGIELPLVPPEGLVHAPLRASGIPIVGYIDLMHGRGTNKGTHDINEAYDPEGTIEVIDWKFTSDIRYAKTPQELPRTIQMATYAQWVFNVSPDTPFTRLSHGYFPNRGQAKKVTVLTDREEISQTWKRVERLASSLRDAAKEPDIDKVEANTRACRAFGRPCAAAGTCKAQMDGAFSFLRRPNRPTTSQGTPMPTLADKLRARNAAAAPVAPKNDAAVDAEKKRLIREQTLGRLPGIVECIEQIRAFNLGFPKLIGVAAGEYGHIFGVTPALEGVDHKIDGEGELAEYVYGEITELHNVLAELKEAMAPAADGASVLPPDAPASNPALAAKTPAATDAIAEQSDGKPAKAEKVKKESKKKPKEEPAPAPAPAGAPTPAASTINLYVNCEIDGLALVDMTDEVQEIVKQMHADSGAGDFRLVDKGSDKANRYAFGAWKATLGLALSSSEIPPGNYAFHSDGGEISIAALEALRSIVRASGGFIVKGGR